jgi:hypothetical protein
MGNRQRRRDLIEQLRQVVQRPVAFFQRCPQAATAQPAHDEKCTAGITPVIVQGNNVDMFEVGDKLGFSLKTSDELRLVGKFRQDGLDRHFTANGRLKGTIDRAKTAFADQFL